MMTRFLLRLPLRLTRWLLLPRRRRRNAVGVLPRLGQAFLFALVTLPCTGYVRGAAFDGGALDQLARLGDGTSTLLGAFILWPSVVGGVVLFLQYALFAAALLALASLVGRVPSYTAFLVPTEYEFRRGHAFSRGEMLLGLTLPISVGLMLACYNLVSLLAWFHAVVAFLYIRFSCDPARVNKMLDWSARVRGGFDDPYADDDQDDANT
jgi:hypothetical protein